MASNSKIVYRVDVKECIAEWSCVDGLHKGANHSKYMYQLCQSLPVDNSQSIRCSTNLLTSSKSETNCTYNCEVSWLQLQNCAVWKFFVKVSYKQVSYKKYINVLDNRAFRRVLTWIPITWLFPDILLQTCGSLLSNTSLIRFFLYPYIVFYVNNTQ